MRFNDVIFMQNFLSWLRKINMHYFDYDASVIFEKNEIEQVAYYVSYLDEMGFTITTPPRENDFVYMTVIFDKENREYLVQKPVFKTMLQSYIHGIEQSVLIIKARRK